MADYSFVIPNSFTPFTLADALQMGNVYTTAYQQTEEKYLDLQDKASRYKRLAETLPEDSEAKAIYEGYAKDLDVQLDSLSRGLSYNNRQALTQLRARYAGEIGALDEADKALQKQRELRTTLGSQDNTIEYAQRELSIDDFLPGHNFNDYRVSGKDLYTRGAAAGKAISDRYQTRTAGDSILGKYYKDIITTQGFSPETIAKFKEKASSIPELQEMEEAILKEYGVTDNLSPEQQERMRLKVRNGILDGIVYQQAGDAVRNPDVLTPTEQVQYDATKFDLDTKKEAWNYEMGKAPRTSKDAEGNTYRYYNDPRTGMQYGTKTDKDGNETSIHSEVSEDGTQIIWKNDSNQVVSTSPNPDAKKSKSSSQQRLAGTKVNPNDYDSTDQTSTFLSGKKEVWVENNVRNLAQLKSTDFTVGAQRLIEKGIKELRRQAYKGNLQLQNWKKEEEDLVWDKLSPGQRQQLIDYIGLDRADNGNEWVYITRKNSRYAQKLPFYSKKQQDTLNRQAAKQKQAEEAAKKTEAAKKYKDPLLVAVEAKLDYDVSDSNKHKYKDNITHNLAQKAIAMKYPIAQERETWHDGFFDDDFEEWWDDASDEDKLKVIKAAGYSLDSKGNIAWNNQRSTTSNKPSLTIDTGE